MSSQELQHARAEVVPLAVNGAPEGPQAELRGAPVVRKAQHHASTARARTAEPDASRTLAANGPSRIRTCNQAVMSRQLYR